MPDIKQTEFTSLVDECIVEAKEEADAFIKEFIDPIADIGSPEKVLDKPMEQFTPEDWMKIKSIYQYDPEVVSKFIFKKSYAELKDLEAGNA